jgi:hypothetical protein
MDFKDIIVGIGGFVFITIILWRFFTSHPSDKYSNDTWREDRRKRKKRG